MMEVLPKLNRQQILVIIVTLLIVVMVEVNIFHSPNQVRVQYSSVINSEENQWKKLLRYKYSGSEKAMKLGNFTNFKFAINCNVCENEKHVYMLILVGSHPTHRDLRNVFRKYLAEPKIAGLTFKTVFLFGQLKNYEEELLREIEAYGDIVQGNFVDSYQNVTLRDLMGFRWTWQYCPQAQYVLRMDDDIALNIYQLVNALEKCCSNIPAFIGCYNVWRNAPVYRTGRYQLSVEEYPNNVFEDYCAGWMYTMTPLMTYLLDWASYDVKFYWLNDVYITGSLVKALGLKHINLNIAYTEDINKLKMMLRFHNYTYVFGPTGADANLTQALLSYYHHKNAN